MDNSDPIKLIVDIAIQEYGYRVEFEARSRLDEASAMYRVTEHMTPEQLEAFLRRERAKA